NISRGFGRRAALILGFAMDHLCSSGRFRPRVVGGPTSRAAAVNHWSRRRDHQAPHPGIELPTHLIEPASDGVDGELPGVVVDSEADIAEVGADVVDPVRDDLAQLLVLEIVSVDLDRFALSPIVAGSSNRCKSSNSVGSSTVNRGVPPPLRRTSPVKEPGFRKSFRPRPIVLRATFVARATAAIPP